VAQWSKGWLVQALTNLKNSKIWNEWSQIVDMWVRPLLRCSRGGPKFFCFQIGWANVLIVIDFTISRHHDRVDMSILFETVCQQEEHARDRFIC
jgi:hypothetical protein